MIQPQQIPFAIAAVALLGCIGPTPFGLLPPIAGPQNSRDADQTAPLVSSPDAFREAADVAPIIQTPAAESTSVTLAAVLLWLASGTVPSIGVFGSFDENWLLESSAEGCLRAEWDAAAKDSGASPGFVCRDGLQ